MKEGWKVKKIGEVCEIKGRIGYRGYTKNDLVEKGQGAITLSPSNILNNIFNTDSCTYISWFKYEQSPEIMVYEGDILFVKTGSTYGKVAIVDKLYEKATINPQFVVLKNIKCLNKYLYYAMTTSVFKERVEGIVGGTATPTLSQTNLAELKIPIPPLVEQEAIVAKLDEAFAAIDQAKANLERNIANAKELFQSKLNQVFSQKGEGWEEKKLEEVCENIIAGGDAPKNNLSNNRTDEYNIPIYANAVKNNGLYGFTNEAKVSKKSLTIAARGSGTGFTCIRLEPYVPIVRLLVLIPNDLITVEFLKLAVDSLVVKSNGSAIPQLTVPMLKLYSVFVPLVSEQQEIVQQLDQLAAQTKQLETYYQQKLDNLEELRKSILEKAFKGELL